MRPAAEVDRATAVATRPPPHRHLARTRQTADKRIEEVSPWAGHSDDGFTYSRYGHAVPNENRSVAVDDLPNY
jgi:hypothetical protein